MSESDPCVSASAQGAESCPTHPTGPPPRPPPPPPTLPPLLVSARPNRPTETGEHAARQSPYLDKLACMPDDSPSQRPKPPQFVYEPVYYFFYGTLMNPRILKDVLGLEAEPVLRAARVYGYELTNWGQYKALVESAPGTEVTGGAYLIESADHEYKLAYYETNAYMLAPCKIYFTDGPEAEEDKSSNIWQNLPLCRRCSGSQGRAV